jgi:serine/threonine-protein kinase
MADAPYEAHFQDLLAKGMASAEEIADARRLLADAAARGLALSAAEALLRAGVKAARAHHAAAPAPDAATAAAEAGAAAAMPTSDLEVLEKLGRGSQAVVFKCRQVSMDRIVAAKILLARSARDPEARDRFLREARQAAALAHPNIVTIHQVLPFRARSASGDDAIDTFCIVMEYIDGGSLADLLAARRRFDPAEAACIIRPVAEALALAHKRGIIHRDIKPGNILLTSGGLVKLADLGLAMPLADAQESGQAGRAYGTPYYISPEQVRGDANTDFRADLYSLAATFYEMVAGVPPFTAPTPQEVMRKHLTESVPDPRQYVPELPDALCRMLGRAMAKNPEYRYESAEDFIAALDKLFPTVDATVAGASDAGKPRPAGVNGEPMLGARRVALPDDYEPVVAPPLADPTVPAAKALQEQLAVVPQVDRRKAGRAPGLTEKAVARPAASRAADGSSAARIAPPSHDPEQERRRNILVISIVGGLVVVAVTAAVVLFLLFPPPSTVARKAKVMARPPASAPAASAPGPGAILPAPAAASPGAATPALPPNVSPAPRVTKAPEPPKPPEPVPAAPPPAPPEEPPPAAKPPDVKPSEPPPTPRPPDAKPPDAKPPAPAKAEAITVRADKAELHGPDIKYEKVDQPAEAYRDNIGFWRNKDAYVTWEVPIVQAGTYQVELTYAVPAGGCDYTFEIAGQKFKAKTEATGGWHDFKPHTLKGAVKIAKAGPVTITVRALAIPKAGGLMNLQSVTLKPVGQ